MTQLLEEAVAAARALPPEDQDAVARLADEAHAEYLAGRTEALDPDRL